MKTNLTPLFVEPLCCVIEWHDEFCSVGLLVTEELVGEKPITVAGLEEGAFLSEDC